MRNAIICILSFFFTVLFLDSCASGNSCRLSSPLVVAHRGGASLGPENSLSAIRRALECGVYAIEVDVRLSACGTVVLMHDSKVDRTTNGKGRVSAMNLVDLKELFLVDDAGNVTQERVPTLDEVLRFIDGRCGLLIEVKGRAEGIERAVAESVMAADALSWVSVQSFSDAVLERFSSLNLPIRLEKLMVFKFPFLPVIFDSSLSFFSIEKYSHISSFNINKSFLSRRLIRSLKENGKGVKAWTFKKGSGGFSKPVDAVITDSPQLWR